MWMKTSAAPKVISKGLCSFCKGEFDKPKMSQHLRNCKERKAILARLAADETKQKTRLFHIQVEGRYAPQYWMHLEMSAQGTLDDLDSFLKDIWFEHYEHLSGFRIDDTSYSSEDGGEFSFLDKSDEGDEETEEDGEEEEENFVNGDDILAELPSEYVVLLPPDLIATLKQRWFIYDLLPLLKEKQKIAHKQMRDMLREPEYRREEVLKVSTLHRTLGWMVDVVEDTSIDVQLQYVLSVGKKFSYTYDYGTSTDLTLRIIAEREGVIGDEKEPVELLALNIAPDIPCVVCGKPAMQIVAGYYNFMEHAYCDECVKNLDGDDSEQVIEIENSPRVGVIG
jgi:hypothetical protein